MKAGTWIYIHTKDGLVPNTIQKVQMKKDPESGFWNHTGILFFAFGIWWVAEATEAKGYRFRGVVRPTPLSKYLERERSGEIEILYREPIEDVDADEFGTILFDLFGTPYDMKNLLVHQPWLYLTGIWVGRTKRKAWKRVACHEFGMLAWNTYRGGYFPNWRKAQVSDPYYSEHFRTLKIFKI